MIAWRFRVRSDTGDVSLCVIRQYILAGRLDYTGGIGDGCLPFQHSSGIHILRTLNLFYFRSERILRNQYRSLVQRQELRTFACQDQRHRTLFRIRRNVDLNGFSQRILGILTINDDFVVFRPCVDLEGFTRFYRIGIPMHRKRVFRLIQVQPSGNQIARSPIIEIDIAV